MGDNQVKLGKYMHFKGNKYEVIGTATHSETLEEMVVYCAQDGDGALWVRPRVMWDETVEYNGKQVKRFVYEEELKAEMYCVVILILSFIMVHFKNVYKNVYKYT